MISIFALLLILGLPAFGIFALVRGFRSGNVEVEGGVCGHCGYSVRGLESELCPECGSDLREVGIETVVRKRSGLWIAVGSLSLVLFMLAFLSLFLVNDGKSAPVPPVKVTRPAPAN